MEPRTPAPKPAAPKSAGAASAGPAPAGKRPPVAGALVTQLLDEIVSGRFAPGTSLPSEAILSRRLGVSRTALREAMRFLAAHGLVESRTRTGTAVLPRQRWNRFDPAILDAQVRVGPDGAVIAELREVIFLLMPRVATLAAERASAADVAAIESRLAALVGAVGGGQQARNAFYGAVFDASGNWVFAQLGRLLGAAFSRPLADAADPERSARWHKALLDAVRQQRPDDARSAMKKLVATQRAAFAEASTK